MLQDLKGHTEAIRDQRLSQFIMGNGQNIWKISGHQYSGHQWSEDLKSYLSWNSGNIVAINYDSPSVTTQTLWPPSTTHCGYRKTNATHTVRRKHVKYTFFAL